MAEGPEVCRSLRHAPGRVHRLVMLQAQQQIAIQVEDIYKSQPRAVDFVLLTRQALGESHHDVAADILNSEGSVIDWYPRIRKSRCAIDVDTVEFCVVDLDLSTDEIGGVETWSAGSHANRQSFVNGAARGVVDFYHR